MSVVRYDFYPTPLKSPERLKNGFLRADAYVSRTGIFEYRNADGSVRRELRPAEEVFARDSLESFSMLPVTDGHPPELVTADNAETYQRGSVSESVKPDGDRIRASMLITNARLIRKMEKGQSQVSCGYVCDMVETPGVWQGQRYDAIQINIRGNHIALVDVGRAGPDISVRMDGAYATITNTTEGKTMTEPEVTCLKCAEFAARADAAEAALTAERSARTDAVADFSAKVSARVALEKTAATHLPNVRLDGMSDKDIKLAVVTHLSGPIPADKLTDAVYDAVLAMAGKVGNPALDAVREASVIAQRSVVTDSKDARKKYEASLRNEHKRMDGGANVADVEAVTGYSVGGGTSKAQAAAALRKAL